MGVHNFRFGAFCFFTTSHKHCRDIASKTQSCCHYSKDKQLPSAFCYYPLLMAWGGGVFTLHLILYKTLGNPELGQNIIWFLVFSLIFAYFSHISTKYRVHSGHFFFFFRKGNISKLLTYINLEKLCKQFHC